MRMQLLMIGALMCIAQLALSQSVRSLVNDGNDLYKDDKFTDAEVNYRKALEKEPALVQGHFNLGNSLYKQGKFDESVKEYEAAALKAESHETQAHTYYNIGNSYLKEQKYQEAVKSYIESLKRNPNDQDAKYNLSYALEKLKQQQQQQNKNDNKQDKNKDKQDRDQNTDKQKQDQEQDQQSQDQKKQEQQRKQQQAQQEKTMSKEDAQRILDVLKNSERDVQKKLRVRQGVRAKTDKDW